MVSYIYLTQLEDLEKAEEYGLLAIKMDPNNDEAFQNLGEVKDG